jgi:hypothetical protein
MSAIGDLRLDNNRTNQYSDIVGEIKNWAHCQKVGEELSE